MRNNDSVGKQVGTFTLQLIFLLCNCILFSDLLHSPPCGDIPDILALLPVHHWVRESLAGVWRTGWPGQWRSRRLSSDLGQSTSAGGIARGQTLVPGYLGIGSHQY